VFGERVVREDLVGDVFEQVIAAQPHVLLIDLIDERFDVVRVGPRWYTMSDYYGRAGLEAPMRSLAEEAVAYRSPERAELFRAAVARVAPVLARALPRTRLVLQQAWYTARSVDPEAGEFYSTATAHAVSSNEALAGFYESLRTSFGRRLHVIEPDRAQHLCSDPAHRWGLMHFHYVPGYYHDVLADVLKVARGPVSAPPWRRRPSSLPPTAAEIDRQPSSSSLST
jgi:hypothetical protein